MRMEQTTAVGIRGMRGMSGMDKKLVSQSTSTALFGSAAKVPTTPPLNEFSCVCATGWTGPTCEISECIKIFNVVFSFFFAFFFFSLHRAVSKRIADRRTAIGAKYEEVWKRWRKVIMKIVISENILHDSISLSQVRQWADKVHIEERSQAKPLNYGLFI